MNPTNTIDRHQVTDFGQAIHESDDARMKATDNVETYYVQTHVDRLPPEAIVHYSPNRPIEERQAGDVFVFATLMWEVFSCRSPLGEPLYRGRKRTAVVQALMSGERLTVDSLWPREIVNLLHKCWNINPSSRPPFHRIASTLYELLNERTLISDSQLGRLSGQHDAWIRQHTIKQVRTSVENVTRSHGQPAEHGCGSRD